MGIHYTTLHIVQVSQGNVYSFLCLSIRSFIFHKCLSGTGVAWAGGRGAMERNALCFFMGLLRLSAAYRKPSSALIRYRNGVKVQHLSMGQRRHGSRGRINRRMKHLQVNKKFTGRPKPFAS